MKTKEEALELILQVAKTMLTQKENQTIKIIDNPKVRVGVPKECKGQICFVVEEGYLPVSAIRDLPPTSTIYEVEQGEGGIGFDVLYK